MEKIRLQKFISDSGIMSRRHAEALISAGKVIVNGNTATLGDKIDPEVDCVLLDGKRIPNFSENKREYTYIKLYKPMGYVTTASDEKGRPCVTDLVKLEGKRLYPVGRLDMYSEGLLLLTDDGAFANRMMHPSGDKSKKYRILLQGRYGVDDVKRFTEPMELDGYKLASVEATLIRTGGRPDSRYTDTTAVEITLHEGRNRQIRRMCEKLGFTVMRLKRIEVGGVKLGELKVGEWRELDDSERRLLSIGQM